MNVYAKFRDFPLCINKALGIFSKTVETRTTGVAIRDAFQRPKITSFFSVAPAVIMVFHSSKPTGIVITTAHYLKHPAG